MLNWLKLQLSRVPFLVSAEQKQGSLITAQNNTAAIATATSSANVSTPNPSTLMGKSESGDTFKEERVDQINRLFEQIDKVEVRLNTVNETNQFLTSLVFFGFIVMLVAIVGTIFAYISSTLTLQQTSQLQQENLNTLSSIRQDLYTTQKDLNSLKNCLSFEAPFSNCTK